MGKKQTNVQIEWHVFILLACLIYQLGGERGAGTEGGGGDDRLGWYITILKGDVCELIFYDLHTRGVIQSEWFATVYM